VPKSYGFRFFASGELQLGSGRIWDAFRESHDLATSNRDFLNIILRRADARSTTDALPASSISDPQASLAGRSDILAAMTVISGHGADATRTTVTAGSGATIRTPGSADLAEGDGAGIATVLVDWPWQIASRLVPFASDWETLADREPIGWAENLLAQRALNSPDHVEFSLSELGAVGEPGSWFWAGVARGGLDLSGDFSAGFALTGLPFQVDRITLADGSDYNLATDDSLVASGDRLVIDATALDGGAHVTFDGSAESDGSFAFLGGESNDFFFGGADNDWIAGGGGADTSRGGGGSDIFIYSGVADSTGANYDTIAGFDPAADRIDLPGAVAGFGETVEGGTLSTATFNDDLAAAVAGLGASQAVWFAPDQGDLAGQIFLIVDGNGQAGYQEGEDFVIAVEGAPLADLSSHTDIFI
jgi:Ca2+-binding RTX toxin-like protein